VDAQDIAAIEDAGERAVAVNQLIDEYQAAIGELSDLRRETLRELLAAGMPQMAIADMLGISKSRVSQLLSAGSRPERAFLGTGAVTVAVGGKLEAGKADPGAVVSSESFGGYEVLADLARSVGLDVAYEVVPPPGHVHLNRANLIVMAGPRLLPFLDQVLEADRHLGFGTDQHGWYLLDKDTGTEYRSPIDRGDPGDYAYLGRLPRPDGKGTFLYLAGIHAPGNLGAAQYIADNLAELHRELKTRRFSVLISCQFDPADRKKIVSTDRLTPLYRHDGP
jgi:predicted XRE-type DNA-binding protein